MRSESVTTVLDTSADEAFDYLSKIENLPEWATEFARELRWENGEAIVSNGLGDFVFRMEADKETGVIDMLAGPTPDELALFPTRVVPLPGKRSAFTFTMFQGPEMPDELFESQHASLLRELDGLEARFREAGAKLDSPR
jgi:hypothetical protein